MQFGNKQLPVAPGEVYDEEVVEAIEKERRQVSRLMVLWTVVAVPTAVIGMLFAVFGMHDLVLAGGSMGSFGISVVIFLIGMSPVYLAYSFFQRKRYLDEVLASQPRD
jgi:predicted nucleic acid-binding Zn ribbon protein